MYWLGRTGWDTGITPPEVVEAFAGGHIPPGPALDLGCGTGTNAIYMAQQGRQVTGIDFAPRAIARARQKAQQAGLQEKVQFFVADVTRLKDLDLPQYAFALDIGCFHGLSDEGRHRYVDGLADRLLPGARLMLFALDPQRKAGISFGVLPHRVQEHFRPHFEIERRERGTHRNKGATWFWMIRRQRRSPGSAGVDRP
jgi:cyclopropane fatty-acyl-phospholipid synthase-like methyltransferase